MEHWRTASHPIPMATVNLRGTQAISWVCDFSGNAPWDREALLNFKDSSTKTQGRRFSLLMYWLGKQAVFLIGKQTLETGRGYWWEYFDPNNALLHIRSTVLYWDGLSWILKHCLTL